MATMITVVAAPGVTPGNFQGLFGNYVLASDNSLSIDVRDQLYAAQAGFVVPSTYFSVAGAPTNGASGTHAAVAPKGALLIDVTNAVMYQNTGTLASPTWTSLVANSVGYAALSISDALTSVGTNRGNSLALVSQINFINTTTSTATGVTLPASLTVGALPGGFVRIIQGGTTSMHVYAAGSDTIDTIAGSTGVVLTNAFMCDYWVTAAGAFRSSRVAYVISA